MVWSVSIAPDIKDLQDQLDAAERDARELVADLSEGQGEWHAETGSWSVAQCLDHLATTNRVYLDGMKSQRSAHASKADLDNPRRRPDSWGDGSLGLWNHPLKLLSG
jgi:uncharacterized damage-inducible protein DinB